MKRENNGNAELDREEAQEDDKEGTRAYDIPLTRLSALKMGRWNKRKTLFKQAFWEPEGSDTGRVSTESQRQVGNRWSVGTTHLTVKIATIDGRMTSGRCIHQYTSPLAKRSSFTLPHLTLSYLHSAHSVGAIFESNTQTKCLQNETFIWRTSVNRYIAYCLTYTKLLIKIIESPFWKS